MAKRHSKSLCKSFLEARADERNQYGESVYLLEPHVKRSRGGIRDLNLLRWLGFAEFGSPTQIGCTCLGAMSKFDHHRLLSSSEYLLRLRNEMHFHAGRSADMLDRAEQLRIADWLGFQQRSGLLPVEQFMRDYFRHTNHIWQMVRRREASLLSVSTAIAGPRSTVRQDGRRRLSRWAETCQRDPGRAGPSEIRSRRSAATGGTFRPREQAARSTNLLRTSS